jgi:Tfp pilus assembly protein PilN
MKITVNLANAPTLRERYAFTLAVPGLILGLLVIVLLGRYAAKAYTERGELARKLETLRVSEAALAEQARDSQAALNQPRARGTLREAQFVNSLIEGKKLSLADVTLQLTALLPPDVRVSSLAVVRSGNNSDLRFQIAGKNEEALLSFMKNLQDSTSFEDPSFTAETVEQQGATAGEITIGCQARFVGLSQKAVPAGKPAAGHSAATVLDQPRGSGIRHLQAERLSRKAGSTSSQARNNDEDVTQHHQTSP